MRYRRLLAACAAICTMAFAAGIASANSLSVDTLDFYQVWEDVESPDQPPDLERLSFNGTVSVRCEVTMLGSFHSATFTKVSGLLIGVINHIEINECEGGTISALLEVLPAHVRFTGFGGTLPEIEEIRLEYVGLALAITVPGFFDCLLRTDASEPLAGDQIVDPRSGVVDGYDISETSEILIDDRGGSTLCDIFGSAALDGGSGVTPDAESGSVTFTLV